MNRSASRTFAAETPGNGLLQSRAIKVEPTHLTWGAVRDEPEGSAAPCGLDEAHPRKDAFRLAFGQPGETFSGLVSALQDGPEACEQDGKKHPPHARKESTLVRSKTCAFSQIETARASPTLNIWVPGFGKSLPKSVALRRRVFRPVLMLYQLSYRPLHSGGSESNR